MKKAQNTQTAQQVFNAAQPANPKQKKSQHNLSKFEEVADKQTERATRRSLFDDMLAEQRGLSANCKLFAKYATDSRMLVVLRSKGVKVLQKDFNTVFTPEFICDNLRADFGLYRYNSSSDICKITLPKKAETAEQYDSAEFEKLTNKDGKTVYLVPMKRYTFDQFLSIVKTAVNNYWQSVREAAQAE